MRKVALLALALTGLLPATPPEPDTPKLGTESAYGWPTFHGNNARTGTARGALTHPPFVRLWTFDLGQHTWKYCQGASVWSASAVAGQVDGAMRVFVGAYDHNVYSLDGRTGKEVWRYTTGCLVKAAPAFAVVEGTPMVFAASSDRAFYGLDARTGHKVWNLETYPWTYTVGESLAGSPLVEALNGRATVFFTMWNGDKRPLRTVQTGELFAVDAASGELRWRREISTQNLTAPTWMVIDGRPILFVGSEDGTVYARDARNGEGIWKFTTGHRIAATPVVFRVAQQPAVLVANGFGMLRCLNAATGKQIWKYKTDHEVLSTPAVVKSGGKLLVLVGSADRCVHCIDAKSSLLAWKFQTGKYVVASPAVAPLRGESGDATTLLFVNSLDNYLYALNAESGCEIMRFPSGDMLWPYETRGASLWSSPSLYQLEPGLSVLLYPAHDGKLYAFTDNLEAGRGKEGNATLATDWEAVAAGEAPAAPRELVPAMVYIPPAFGLLLVLVGVVLTLRGVPEEPDGATADGGGTPT